MRAKWGEWIDRGANVAKTDSSFFSYLICSMKNSEEGELLFVSLCRSS
jgi:hypothetical protein